MTEEPNHIGTGDSSTGAPRLARRAVIELDYEFVDERNVDSGYLEEALSPLRDLPLTGNIRVVVTSQMNASLATRVGNHYSNRFRQRRIIGRVTAKTVTDQSSSTEILLDAVVLLPEVRDHLDGTPQRLLLHEGHHLILRDRGEDAHACVRGLNPKEPATEVIAWMAALALEEYRIESMLCRDGAAGVPYDRQLPATLADWYAALANAGAQWGGLQAEKSLEITSEIITRCAYVAADHRFSTPLGDTVIHSEHWRSLVGECWPALLQITESVPSADVPLMKPDLAAMVRDVADLAEVWCERIGIALSSEGGELCVQPLNIVAPADRSAA